MEAVTLNAFDPERIPEKVKVDLCILAIQMIMEGQACETEMWGE